MSRTRLFGVFRCRASVVLLFGCLAVNREQQNVGQREHRTACPRPLFFYFDVPVVARCCDGVGGRFFSRRVDLSAGLVVRDRYDSLSLDQVGKGEYDGVFDCGKKIFKAHGIKGAYQGFSAVLLRNFPCFGAYFFCFEVCCRSTKICLYRVYAGCRLVCVPTIASTSIVCVCEDFAKTSPRLRQDFAAQRQEGLVPPLLSVLRAFLSPGTFCLWGVGGCCGVSHVKRRLFFLRASGVCIAAWHRPPYTWISFLDASLGLLASLQVTSSTPPPSLPCLRDV